MRWISADFEIYLGRGLRFPTRHTTTVKVGLKRDLFHSLGAGGVSGLHVLLVSKGWGWGQVKP
jgi:hypothetical protein